VKWESANTDKDLLMTHIKSPHDLLHAIPFLVGYHPSNSIVFISLRNDEVGFAMRIDYADTWNTHLLTSICTHLLRESSDSLFVVFYPDNQPEGDSEGKVESDCFLTAINECIHLLTELKVHFHDTQLSITEAIAVYNGRWRSLICSDVNCCPQSGTTLENIETSRIAAEQVFNGNAMPLDSREQMLATLAYRSDSEQAIEIARKLKSAPELREDDEVWRTGAVANFLDQLEQFMVDGRVGLFDSGELARFIADVQDLTIRDYCFGLPLSVSPQTLLRLWNFLLTITPPGYRAPFATLFADIAYESGNGALAMCALDIADEDNPTYAMSSLLRRAFSSGWPPEAFSAMRNELHPQVCMSIFGKEIDLSIAS
jgi:hypothetical protein